MGGVSTRRSLLIFRLIWGGVEQRDCQVKGHDLGVRILLAEAAGVQQGLVGPICELDAVHFERMSGVISIVVIDADVSRDRFEVVMQ